MAVPVPFDGGGDGEGEGEGGRDKAVAVAVAVADPVPAPMDVDGDRGALDVLAPAHMDRDRDGGDDRVALVASTSNGGRRRGLLNDLPEDILAGILGRLRDTSAAARTSLLSRRWRHVWKMGVRPPRPTTPAPCAPPSPPTTCTRPPTSNQLYVTSIHSATPDATASWLRVAAPLISGELLFCNRGSVPFHTLFDEVFRHSAIRSKKEARSSSPASREPPRFGCALGFFAYRSLPPSGVFAALRELHLVFVRFNGGELTLDDTRMPFLEGVEIWCSRGLASLTIRLKHLISMNLYAVRGVVWAQCRGAETQLLGCILLLPFFAVAGYKGARLHCRGGAPGAQMARLVPSRIGQFQ